MFAALSTSIEFPEFPVQTVSNKKTSKKVSKPKTSETTLKDEMAAFEYYNPVGMILFHFMGKYQFLIFNFKFSHVFWVVLSAYDVKKITLSVIEKIINEQSKKTK